MSISPALILSVVKAATELTYMGFNVSKYIEEMRANNGELSPESLAEVEQEARASREYWEGRR